MNILFIDKDWKGRTTGPTVWRSSLTKEIRKKNTVTLISIGNNPIKNFLTIIKNHKKIMNSQIIQTHVSTFQIIKLCSLLKFFGKKHVHMLHGDYFLEAKDKGKFYVFKYNCILKLADVIVFPTQYLQKQIMQKKEVKSNCVIYPGIKIARAKRKKIKEIKNFVEITSFTRKEKCAGIVPLINAFNETKKLGETLTIIGGGPYLKKYKNNYSSKEVIFLGRKKNAEKLLKKYDAFVHSSFLESFGIVLLEAMNCRMPILTVNIQGIPEAIGKGGIIVEPTKKELKKGLVLLREKKFGETLKAQKEQLQKFEWKKITKSFENIYALQINPPIFLVRHGETNFNVEGKITGQKESALTAKGILQAEKIGAYFEKIPLHKVYSSDLKRAIETAKKISPKIQKTSLLRELNFGNAEGKKTSQVKNIFSSGNMKAKYPKGESLEELKNRLKQFLTQINTHKVNVIVAHEGTNKMLKSILINKNYNPKERQNNNEIIEICCKNAEIIRVN
jgi:phosphoserine phosphatase